MRLIAIPLLIFSAIKGFFTGFETSMEEGNGVLYSIMMGLVGSLKGVLTMAFDLVTEPIKLLVDFIKYVGSFIPKSITDPVSNFMGTDKTTKQRAAENTAGGDNFALR